MNNLKKFIFLCFGIAFASNIVHAMEQQIPTSARLEGDKRSGFFFGKEEVKNVLISDLVFPEIKGIEEINLK